MKISKLFHWLYAILMLLPFAFFVPSVLYYAFNDNATMQNVEVPKTETISVDFNQMANIDYEDYSNVGFITNEYIFGTYHCAQVPSNNFNRIGCWFNVGALYSNHKILVKSNLVFYTNQPVHLDFAGLSGQAIYPGSFDTSIINEVTFERIYSIPRDSSSNEYYIYSDGVTSNDYFVGFDTIQIFDLTQMFGSGNEPTVEEFNTYFPNSYYPYTESELMQITYDTGETEQLVENTSIINYAWESIWDLPLFSWTKVTFVSVPFSYLTGIFGIGASNSLNYVFGYFVTISIVWLVFDLLLYVPMLAHNWIDKARIE